MSCPAFLASLPLVPSAASASVTYLHEAGTKWKFVAALLIAIGRQPPSAAPTSPATSTPRLPDSPTLLSPPLAVSHVSSCCHFNVSSVLFARVTYFDFICPLARKIRQETGKLRQCRVGRRQEEVGGGQGGGIVGVLRYPVDLLLCLIHAQIVAEIWRQVY